jgi:proline iminopeptidase
MKIKLDDEVYIHCERMGNLQAPTILFNHGGPGIGYSEKDKALFDFSMCNVIFYDQRGCGRSTRSEELSNMTTQNLVKDVERILQFFKLDKIILYGGSWGSTLSLLYTLDFPNKVKAIVLRGLFLGDLDSRRFFEKGAVADVFPEAWSQLASSVGIENNNDVMDSIFRAILQEDSSSKKLAYELLVYGHRVNNMGSISDKEKTKIRASDFWNVARILAHFSVNSFFLPDQFIIKSLAKLHFVPVHIIHGKNDYITPISFAETVSKQYNNIHLYPTEGGHSHYEEVNKNKITEVLDKLLTELQLAL